MKIFYFLKWCLTNIIENIKSWDQWMWAWCITCAWGPSAILKSEENPTSYNLFILFVFLFWICYGIVFTSIKRAWTNFNKEQDQLITHLKGKNDQL